MQDKKSRSKNENENTNTLLSTNEINIGMEKIPAWIERLLLPKLNEITGEIKAIHTRVDSVEKEIVGLRREMLDKVRVGGFKIRFPRK